MITLRPVEATDLDEFFSHQLDPSANHMAAFGAKNPSDRGVFDNHWQDILNDGRITVRTILSDGEVVLIAPDLAVGALWLAHRMLTPGGELVTVLLGSAMLLRSSIGAPPYATVGPAQPAGASRAAGARSAARRPTQAAMSTLSTTHPST